MPKKTATKELTKKQEDLPPHKRGIKIRKLHLENFKAFDDFTIEFPEPVFSITDSPEKCMDFLLAAGVHDTEIFVEQLSFTVENVDDCWRQVASSLLVRPRLAVLNKEEYQQVKQEVRNQLAERITGEGMEVAIPAIFCRIRKK